MISRFLAIDPGESIGVAEFDDEGTLTQRSKIKRSYFKHYLDDRFNPDYSQISDVIVENFRVFPGMEYNFILNTFNVVRVIGFIEAYCHINGAEFHLQEPNVRTSAEKWLGFQYKSHTPDDKAAHAHGVKWLVNNRILTVEKAIKDNEEYDQRDH